MTNLRIIQANSNPGDLVLDPFCGCGTTIDAAEKLGRDWIGIDVTQRAISLIKNRLQDTYGNRMKFVSGGARASRPQRSASSPNASPSAVSSGGTPEDATGTVALPQEKESALPDVHLVRIIGEPTTPNEAVTLAEEDKFQFQWWALGLVGARPVEQKKGADHGIDGKILFRDDPKAAKPEQIIIQVKGGKTGVKDVRDLRGVLDREKAAIGILISLQPPTGPMETEAASAGFYEHKTNRQKFPRLQLRTVKELMEGKGIQRPTSAAAIEDGRQRHPAPDQRRGDRRDFQESSRVKEETRPSNRAQDLAKAHPNPTGSNQIRPNQTMKAPGLKLFTAASLAAALIWVTPAARAAEPKPHILFILADDLGWKDVGFHGSDIKTPNLDKLAAGGAKLTQFYALPMCTPTRAALMTGRYPLRYGLQTGVIPTSQTYGLPTDEWLLPQALKEAGYTTAIIGKWHLGHGDQKLWPRQRGFDHQYGPLIGEIDYFTHEASRVVDWYRNNEQVKEAGYSTTLLGNEAVKFLNGHDPATPLYLYLAFNAAHTPYQATQEYLDQYQDIADPNRRAYAGSITAMDGQIGRVLAALDQKKMRDNTLIVFMSDNGGTRNAMFAGAIADVSKAKIPCDNGPYREGKGMNYEGGTRVVAFANWPGHIKAGSSVDGMIHAVDWYPTLVGLAGGSTAKAKPLDGLDVWATVSEGKASPRSEVVYNFEPFRTAVRQGDWKLVWRTALPASIELYNIPQDPSEKNNLAAQHPGEVAALQQRANELAAQAAKPLLLEVGFKFLLNTFHLPPAFPGEEFDLAHEH